MTPDRLQSSGILIPGFASNGVEIRNPKDQRELTRVLREHQRNLLDPELRGLYDRLNVWVDRVIDRFYPAIRLGVASLPTPVIGIAPEHVNVLAHYKLTQDELGLYYRINFNQKHFRQGEILPGIEGLVWDYGGEYGMVETLTHELGHHWQQERGENPYKQGKQTHNAEFVAKMTAIGIHFASQGFHTEPATGDFQKWMESLGYKRPEMELAPDYDLSWWFKFFKDMFDDRDRKKKKACIHKEHCPTCSEIRYSTKKEARPIICGVCHVLYVRDENGVGVSTPYEAKGADAGAQD